MVTFREDLADYQGTAIHRNLQAVREVEIEGNATASGSEDENKHIHGRGSAAGHGETSQSEAEDAVPALPTKGRERTKSKLKKHVQPKHTWMRIDKHGNTSFVSTDKYRTALKLGIQPRDLRLLDPQLASVSPPAILDRELAIVFNMDMIKCIITMDYVLVINPEDEHAANLIAELKSKLVNPMHVGKVMSYPGLSRISDVRRFQQSTMGGTGAAGFGGPVHQVGLSFELKVLEICLDLVVHTLDQEAKELEHIVLPALENLTRRVKASELELVRRSKNRLTRLRTRVESTKEVLERFLQDDQDMHRLHLTAIEMSRQITLQANLQSHVQDAMDRAVSLNRMGSGSRGHSKRASRHGSAKGSVSSSSSGTSFDSADEAEIAEVEMLLEAYQMHLDTTHNKLQTLEEYVQDTEDLVNTSLDSHRNRIISVDIVLTSFLTMLGLSTTISGFFGMNLPNGDLPELRSAFNQVAILGCSVIPFVLLVTFLIWARSQGFMSR